MQAVLDAPLGMQLNSTLLTEALLLELVAAAASSAGNSGGAAALTQPPPVCLAPNATGLFYNGSALLCACALGFVGGGTNVCTAAATVSTFVGSLSMSDTVDGTGTLALLGGLVSMVLDAASGNLFATDGVRVRRVTPSGVVTTLPVPSGGQSFAVLSGIAVDSTGGILVNDRNMNVMWRYAPAAGNTYTLSVYAGSYSNRGHVDGPISSARFVALSGMAIDAAKRYLYIMDANCNEIRKLDTQTGFVSTVAGNMGLNYTLSGVACFATRGYVDGPVATARFAFNGGAADQVVVATDGSVYFTDYFNYAIRKISADGSTVSTFAGGKNGRFGAEGVYNGELPSGLALDNTGAMFVSLWRSGAGDRIVRISSDGATITHVVGVSRPDLCDGTPGGLGASKVASLVCDSSGGGGALYASATTTIRRITFL
jgi:streptogramin lyase